MTDMPLQPGQPPITTPAVQLSETDIIAYAREFDPQPAHIDGGLAASSAFGELVASGWQTVAVSLHLAEAALGPIAPTHCTIESIKWQRPVRPGDTLHAVVTVLERSGQRRRFQIDTLDQNDAPVQFILGWLEEPPTA